MNITFIRHSMKSEIQLCLAVSLLGINHEKFALRHDGIDRRLTHVHGYVIKGIIS